MGRVVILVYKPHEGKETELRQLIREHRNALVGKGLVTDMMVSPNDERFSSPKSTQTGLHTRFEPCLSSTHCISPLMWLCPAAVAWVGM